MDAVMLHEEEKEYYSDFPVFQVMSLYIKNNVFITCADGRAYAIGSDS